MDGFLSFCFLPFVFNRFTVFFVRISMGVNEDTAIKRPRNTIVVKMKAFVGGYKYIPGRCVIFAVTNKKNCEKTSQNCIPKKIDKIPINIFSVKTSRCNCFFDIPKIVKIPNCFLRTFKNDPIE